MHEGLLYLDGETKDGEYKVTSFSFSFEDLISDFGRWMRERELVFSDIKYATVYRGEDDEPVADLVVGEDKLIELVPRQPDRRLTHRIVLLIRRLRNRFR